MATTTSRLASVRGRTTESSCPGSRFSGSLFPEPAYRPMKLLVSLLLALLALPVHAAGVETGDPALDPIFDVLLGRDFHAKEQALRDLVASGHPQRYHWIEGILDGRLRVLKKQKRLVWVEKEGRRFQAVDAFSGEALGEFKKRKLKKFTINNTLRRSIRALLATRDLDSPDPQARWRAVEAMLQDPSPTQLALLQPRMEKEIDPEVRQAMRLVVALAQLQSDNETVRLQAITAVENSLEPAIRQALTLLADGDSSPQVRKAAAAALRKIEGRVRLMGHLETLFFGLSLGSVLVLAAIGLAIT
ncbi:MAG TPA: hypothetical protein EYP90_02450, partial [Chromatiaceae bacterium]|nr:hypothetical protein [Chromatiaceae bacterium]